ncbi:efflux RND transporter periplasmic adaptor subunit [Paraferrimonas sedimenticola]|uniref:MexH family multidrug efflux RND transporter periplasmic adaptor subunit n=1 Tax=Paraferrimonas sedimenticola TaxID=375674 RepID=A0AA37RK81_9GAMM|nr:efflux RND transporter periplasmic adaptor subunit [Paraferrimonas sedimenticola]GLP94760.1 MexH family multidrug efflux RND transporter periplasmic adaptor subunit [Paraferrimonas sedimenticola]
MKKIIIALLVIVAAGAAYLQFSPKEAAKGPQKRGPGVVNVVVTDVTEQVVQDRVEALGTTRAKESVTITSKVTEKIDSISFDDGDMVSAGQLLVTLRQNEQAAKVRAAKVQLADHIREYQRIDSLVTNQTIAELERDRLQTLIDTARANLSQSEAELQTRSIKAPFAGRLGLRQVSTGSLVSTGQEITTLDDISTIKLDFSVPERFLGDLRPGSSVEAISAAYPDKVFRGTVKSLDSRIDPETRAVVVRAEIPNQDGLVLPGMLMKVRLIKAEHTTLVVPESAIIPLQADHFVYLVDDSGMVERKQVKIGIRQRGLVELVDGVSEGQQVVIRGAMKVRVGQKVNATTSEPWVTKR